MKLATLTCVSLLALAPGLVLAQENACVAPGVLVGEDAAGDAANGLGGTEGTGLPFSDILTLHVAEPRELTDRLVFTLKVADLAPAPAPLHRWIAYFTTPDDVEWYAAMSTAEGPTPVFEYGRSSVLENPATPVGSFEYVGDLDPASSYSADGTITLVVDTAAVGFKPGDLADYLYAKVRRSSPRETQNVGLTLDDSCGGCGSGNRGGGSYTLAGNANCSAGKTLLSAGAWGLPALLMLGGLALARRRAR